MGPRSQEAYDGILRSQLHLDIPARSRTNVQTLWATLAPLSAREFDFYMAFIRLPFILEHRSQSWSIIKGATKESPGVRNWQGKLLSLFEIAKVMAVRDRTYTSTRAVLRQN